MRSPFHYMKNEFTTFWLFYNLNILSSFYVPFHARAWCGLCSVHRAPLTVTFDSNWFWTKWNLVHGRKKTLDRSQLWMKGSVNNGNNDRKSIWWCCQEQQSTKKTHIYGIYTILANTDILPISPFPRRPWRHATQASLPKKLLQVPRANSFQP